MKTPERWRALPRHALLASILDQKLSNEVKTSRCDVTWHHMSWQNGSVQSTQVVHIKKVDLQTHLRYYGGQCPCQILGLYLERLSCESADRHTDRHTTGPILYPWPLTREETTQTQCQCQLVYTPGIHCSVHCAYTVVEPELARVAPV